MIFYYAAFGQKSFWDNRYSSFGVNSALYEWYLSWNVLRPYLVEHIPLFRALDAGSKSTNNDTTNTQNEILSNVDSVHILEVGCGNSGLSLNLWKEWGGRTDRVPHLQSVIAIDFCDRVIEVMRARCATPTTDTEHGLIYLVAHAQDLRHFYLPLPLKTTTRTVQQENFSSELKTKEKPESTSSSSRVSGQEQRKEEEVKRVEVVMPEQTSRYSVVIDKGTLDSMVCTPNADTLIRQYLHEVSRVLRSGGYFVLVSCALNEERISIVANTKLYQWHIRQNILHVKQQQQPLLPSSPFSSSSSSSSSDVEEMNTNIYIILLQKE